MLIKTKTEGNLCVAEILGELDHHTSEETKKEAGQADCRQGMSKDLVLDLARPGFYGQLGDRRDTGQVQAVKAARVAR